MVVILLCFAAVHVGLLAWSFNWRSACPWRQWFLRFMLLGTVYDNLIVAAVPLWLGSSLYESANIPRFLIHAAVIPFLVLFALSVMGSARVKLALNRLFRAFCCLFVLAALCFGLWHEVWLLELAPKTALGFTRLSSAATLPPLATIFSNLLVLPMAALVWRQSGWPWFFLGALFIFTVNGRRRRATLGLCRRQRRGMPVPALPAGDRAPFCRHPAFLAGGEVSGVNGNKP